MQQIVGNSLIGLGLVFLAFGILGIFRFRNFYARILVASKIDTVAFITIMIGVFIRTGLNAFSLRILLILIIMLMINPLITHIIARSAYMSGYKVKKGDD